MKSRVLLMLAVAAAVLAVGIQMLRPASAQVPRSESEPPQLGPTSQLEDLFPATASTSQQDFDAAFNGLRRVLDGSLSAPSSDNRFRNRDTVGRLAAAFEKLFDAGQRLQKSRKDAGQPPLISPYLINPEEMSEFRALLKAYSDASNDGERNRAKADLMQFVEARIEAFDNFAKAERTGTSATRSEQGRLFVEPRWEGPRDVTQPDLAQARPITSALQQAIRALREAKDDNAKAGAVKQFTQQINQLPGRSRARIDVERLNGLCKAVLAAEEGPQKAEAAQRLEEFLATQVLVFGGGQQTQSSTSAAMPGTVTREGVVRQQNPMEQQVRGAIEAFRNSSEEGKPDARQRLKDVMEQYFDQDLKRRETEVASIEERVRNLKTQLERRRQKRGELIDLQIKLAENDAEGLDFFWQPAAPARNDLRGPAYTPPPAGANFRSSAPNPPTFLPNAVPPPTPSAVQPAPSNPVMLPLTPLETPQSAPVMRPQSVPMGSELPPR
jgi:hypothetical protein